MSFPMPIVRKAALVSNASYCYVKSNPKLLKLKNILVLIVPLAPWFKETTKPPKRKYRHTHAQSYIQRESSKSFS